MGFRLIIPGECGPSFSLGHNTHHKCHGLWQSLVREGAYEQ